MTAATTGPRLPYEPSRRDQIAYRLASAALRLASPTYRALLKGTWRLGLATAAAPTGPEPRTDAAVGR